MLDQYVVRLDVGDIDISGGTVDAGIHPELDIAVTRVDGGASQLRDLGRAGAAVGRVRGGRGHDRIESRISVELQRTVVSSDVGIDEYALPRLQGEVATRTTRAGGDRVIDGDIAIGLDDDVAAGVSYRRDRDRRDTEQFSRIG